MKKKILALTLLLSLACVSILSTPNDFPPPPLTVIVEFPHVTALPTFELRPSPIMQEKMSDARAFHLILLTRVAAGDSAGIAEMVKYPIPVNLDRSTVIATADEFELYYDRIFNNGVIEALTETSEGDLILLPEGVRVGQGEIWFNLFCTDAACADTQFLITQINN